MARLMLITLCLALGFSAVAIPTAFGSSGSAGVPNPPITRQSDTLNAAQAACAVLNAFQRVTECYVREFNPSIDVTIVATRNEAIGLCNAASKVVRDRADGIAGKGWALRIISPSTMTPTALCRVI
jgi:hypothetical protein